MTSIQCIELEKNNFLVFQMKNYRLLTPTRLGTKGKYYEEQADYYERYITDCLAKQTAVKEGKRKRSLRTSFRSKSTSTSVKYSAEELKKKKILISITENIDNWKRLQVVFRIFFKLLNYRIKTLLNICLVYHYTYGECRSMDSNRYLHGRDCIDDSFNSTRPFTEAVRRCFSDIIRRKSQG